MAQPMIEIRYLDGRVRRIPETEFVADGECVTSVIDIGLDDLSGGLVVYYRHYAPVRPDMGAVGAGPDPRGMPAALWNDSFAVVIPPGEMERIERVYYEGELALLRLDAAGGLVRMHRVNRALTLYVGGRASENVRLQIAEALSATRAACAERAGAALSEPELERTVCDELGVPIAVARECADFQLAYALVDHAYAKRNGLPSIEGANEAASPVCEKQESDEYEPFDMRETASEWSGGRLDASDFDYSS